MKILAEVAVDLAARALRGEIDLANEDAIRGEIKRTAPGVLPDKAIQKARDLVASVDARDAKTMPDTELAKTLRLAEQDQWYQDRKKFLLQEMLEMRKEAARAGHDPLAEGDAMPEFEKAVRALWKSGTEVGQFFDSDTQAIFNEILATKDARVKNNRRDKRRSFYRADLDIISSSLEALGRNPGADAAAHIQLDVLFGKEDANRLRRVTKGNFRQTFVLLREAVQERLSLEYAAEILKLVQMKDIRSENLIPKTKREIDALVKHFNFPVEIAQKLQDAKDDLKLADRLASKRQITPEHYQRLADMRLLMSVIHSADGRSTTSLRVHQPSCHLSVQRPGQRYVLRGPGRSEERRASGNGDRRDGRSGPAPRAGGD